MYRKSTKTDIPDLALLKYKMFQDAGLDDLLMDEFIDKVITSSKGIISLFLKMQFRI